MAKFIKSAQNKSQFITDKTLEICFIGRSNVGKSSLINAIAKQNIARSSNTPGRTQLVNFFDFGKYRLVDLPGYGFAKVSKSKKEELVYVIEDYLSDRANLVAVFQLCDINVITNDDAEMSVWFENNYKNHIVVLNKVDKANRSYFDNNKVKIAKFLNVSVDRLIPVSAKSGTNISQLEKKINEIVYNEKEKIRLAKIEAKKEQDEDSEVSTKI